METSKPKDHHIGHNAIKLIGEAVLPGASLLLDGKILEGGAHVLAGIAAGAILGPIGVAVVIANSYSKSTTGKNLIKEISKEYNPQAEHKIEGKMAIS